MININFTISLIQYIQKNKSHHLTLLLTYRKLCLYKNLQEIDVDKANINQVNLELNSDKTKVQDNKTNLCANKRKRKRNESNSYIKNYVNTVNSQGDIYPLKYMQFQRPPVNTLYLTEQNTATKFTNLIIDDLSKNMTYVAEANPGTGILTEELLKAGVKSIHAYEPNECFHPILSKLKNKYPNRFHLTKENLFNMSKLYYMDCQDEQQRVEALLKDVKHVPWKDNTCMQVIGAVANIVFLKHLILCVVFQSCFMSRGRTSFYLALTPSMWHGINSPQHIGRAYSKYVLFKTLFNCKYLGELNRVSYIPWIRETSLKFNYKKYLHESFYVVKIEPKENIFEEDLKSEQLLPYWYFVKHHVKSSKQRVIPELEKWIPGCGFRLIKQNYNIFTRFVDLTPREILSLYKDFRSWPEFKNSHFLACADSYIQVMKQNKFKSCI